MLNLPLHTEPFPTSASGGMSVFPGAVKSMANSYGSRGVWLGTGNVQLVTFNAGNAGTLNVYDYREPSGATIISGVGEGPIGDITGGVQAGEFLEITMDAGGYMPDVKNFIVTIDGGDPADLDGVHEAYRTGELTFKIRLTPSALPNDGEVFVNVDSRGLANPTNALAAGGAVNRDGIAENLSNVYNQGASLLAGLNDSNKVFSAAFGSGTNAISVDAICNSGMVVQILVGGGTAVSPSVSYRPRMSGATRRSLLDSTAITASAMPAG